MPVEKLDHVTWRYAKDLEYWKERFKEELTKKEKEILQRAISSLKEFTRYAEKIDEKYEPSKTSFKHEVEKEYGVKVE